MVSKLVTTTAKGGLIADNQYGKIYSSSPAGSTENQALTLNRVGAFLLLFECYARTKELGNALQDKVLEQQVD